MIYETFREAVQNIWSNKFRTFLTMLGIIIGVMAVIVIVGLGNGMTNMMQDFYSDMGSDILAVNVMTASTRSVEVNDVYRIINEKPEYYKGLSPIASAGSDTLRVAGEKYRRTNISGVNEDYTIINNYKVAKGRGIQYTDLMDNKNICVIGDYVDRKIFGGNGLGSTLKVGANEFRIVGVLEGRSKPAAQYEGGNDDVVLVPYTTLMSVNNTSSVSEYYVVLQDADHSDEAQEFLQSRLKKLVSKDDYVYVMSLSAAMSQMSSMINIMVGVLTAIAGISLLVGGIGIMNIMLVSVTERTREIGIRKALGAKERTILAQFVVEAATTSALGGVLGIALGYIVSMAANKLLPILAGGTDIMPVQNRENDREAVFIDISGAAALHRIVSEDGVLSVGAAATFAEIERNALLRQYAPVLCLAASQVGSPQIRNLGTIGGNVAHGSPAADTLPVLAMLDAEVRLYSATEGTCRDIPVDTFITGPGQTLLRPGEYIEALRFSPPEASWRMAYEKVGRRNALAISRLSACCAARWEGQRLTGLRLALGAVFPTPRRLYAAEALLLREQPSPAAEMQAAELVTQAAGRRASASYKLAVTPELLLRTLRRTREEADQ